MNEPLSFKIIEILFKNYGILLSNIGDAITWLYEKYNIWITINWSFSEKAPSTKVKWSFSISNVGNREKCVELGIDLIWFNSPTDAYEAAIEYCLINLI